MIKSGRKPANLMPHGIPTHREAVWTEVRKLKEFSAIELHDAMPAPRLEIDAIQYYLRGWNKAGYISEVQLKGRGVACKKRYTLVKDTGVHPPIVNVHGKAITNGLGRQQMWTAIRMTRQFNFKQLAAIASTDDLQVSEVDAESFVSILHRAGYLRMVSPSSNNGTIAVYTLIPSRNTGPKPPLVQRTKVVIDQNERVVVYPKGEEVQGDF